MYEIPKLKQNKKAHDGNVVNSNGNSVSSKRMKKKIELRDDIIFIVNLFYGFVLFICNRFLLFYSSFLWYIFEFV